jgi:sulfite reductase alpha subunit-like flavoprotein
MAKDVDAAVTTMISNRRAAHEYEQMLVADKRYVRDAY